MAVLFQIISHDPASSCGIKDEGTYQAGLACPQHLPCSRSHRCPGPASGNLPSESGPARAAIATARCHSPSQTQPPRLRQEKSAGLLVTRTSLLPLASVAQPVLVALDCRQSRPASRTCWTRIWSCCAPGLLSKAMLSALTLEEGRATRAILDGGRASCVERRGLRQLPRQRNWS